MQNEQNLIGQRLNEALLLRGKLQKELARELGLIDNTVSYFVSGKRTPNPESLIKISRYLDVSVDFLLGLTDIASTNADVKAACEYTGLSEMAVINLHFHNIEKPKVFTDNELNPIVLQAQDLFLMSQSNPLTIVAQYKLKMKELVEIEKEYLKVLREMNSLSDITVSDIGERQVIEKEARLLLFEAAEWIRNFSEVFADEEIRQHEKLKEDINQRLMKPIHQMKKEEDENANN